MTATAQEWQAEWQRGDGKGITPCRQVLLIADLHEAQERAAVCGQPVADCEVREEARR